VVSVCAGACEDGRVPRRRLHLTLAGRMRDEPVIASLARGFDLRVNLGRAHIEEDSGWVIVDMDGSDEELERATQWLRTQGVDVEELPGEG